MDHGARQRPSSGLAHRTVSSEDHDWRPRRGYPIRRPQISRFVKNGGSGGVTLPRISNLLESGKGTSVRSGTPVRSSRFLFRLRERSSGPGCTGGNGRANRQGGRVHGRSNDGIVRDPILGHPAGGSHACDESSIALRVPRGPAITLDRIRRPGIDRDRSRRRGNAIGHGVGGDLAAREKWPGDGDDVEWKPRQLRQRRARCEPDDAKHAGRIVCGPRAPDEGFDGLSRRSPERPDDLARRPARSGIERRAAGCAGRTADGRAPRQRLG
jgi:hypothetical protein